MTRLRVDAGVFDRFPGLTVVVATASGVGRDGGAAVASYLEEAWRDAGALRETYASPQSHPHVAAWREAFKAIGVSPREFPSSVESLLRRSFKGGDPPRVNPLVDFYNAVSLHEVVPAGGFDRAALPDEVALRLTRTGDTFTPLDGGPRIAVDPGEVAYATGATVLTRHFVWRQSREALISESTTEVVLVAEVLGDISADVVGRVEARLREGLRDLFGVAARTGRVTAAAPEADLSPPPAPPGDS